MLLGQSVKASDYPFEHGARHVLAGGDTPKQVMLFDSYHCSRYNTNTGRLTPVMFEAVFERARALVDA